MHGVDTTIQKPYLKHFGGGQVRSRYWFENKTGAPSENHLHTK